MRIRSLPLLVTLTSGILSFVLLSTVELQIEKALSSRARLLLGADLSLSSRRWIRDEERKKVEESLKSQFPRATLTQSETLELFTMASSGQETPQLVALQASAKLAPLVGALELEGSCPNHHVCVFGDAPLALRWKLQAGQSKIKIGEKEFLWGGRIERDTTRSLRGGDLAPRLIILREHLASTGLLRTGATFTVRRFFALEPAPSGGELSLLSRKINGELTDPGIQIQIPQDAAADEGRLLSNVGDFLGLTALVGLVLAFLGCYWLFRRVVQTQAQTWAIYRVLSHRMHAPDRPFWSFCIRLGLLAAVLSLLFAQGLWLLASPRISTLLLMEGRLDRWISPLTIAQASVLALGTLVFAMVPSLRFLRRQSLLELLKNPAILAQRPGFNGKDLLAFVTALFFASRWVSHSWRVAALFCVGMAIAALLAALLGHLVLRLFERSAHRFSRVEQRLSLLALSRLRTSSLLLWTTLTLGALLISLMPLLEKSLRLQLSDPRGAGPVPSLFLFDIQEEQLDPVKKWASSESTSLQFITPLIRGRLLKINDTPFEKLSDLPTTREEEREARFRNRGFNLTYRSELTPSERQVAGVSFSELPTRGPNDPEAVSVEKRFAERLKMKLGDLLFFDIQGVPITARITSIRSVQWTSFQPNFFLVFEPRALVDAPKTYLASLPSMDTTSRERIQRSLFEDFPNVSTIDVTRLMETLLEGFGQISQALGLMALLSALAGGMAVFGIARLRSQERLGELQLLKLLGMESRALFATVTGELAVIASASALTGLCLSTLLASALSLWIFDSPVVLPGISLAVFLLAGFLIVGVALGAIASWRSVNAAPQSWLRALADGS